MSFLIYLADKTELTLNNEVLYNTVCTIHSHSLTMSGAECCAYIIEDRGCCHYFVNTDKRTGGMVSAIRAME